MEPNFAKNMREYREKRGYSVLQLANEAGLSETAIRGWELGKRSPNLMTLLCVCNVFHCTIDEYVMGEKAV